MEANFSILEAETAASYLHRPPTTLGAMPELAPLASTGFVFLIL